MGKTISEYDDIINALDIIERYEEIEESADGDEADERAELEDLLSQLKDCGLDEKWRGHWYPATLIRDSYFKDYAKELAEDIGAVDCHAKWPMTCIDWGLAAHLLQQDYQWVEYRGVRYWFR